MLNALFRLELYNEMFTTQKCDTMNLRMSQYQQLFTFGYKNMLTYDKLIVCYIG